MDHEDVVVKVPASTANLGPGFDSIGMALQLYTTIKMKRANRTVIYNNGANLEGLPLDKENLLYKVACFIYERAGYQAPELEIEVTSDIPLTRGLGSSASAIIGGMIAANVLLGEPFKMDEIYQFGAEMEGHPDNVGASLFGGIVIAACEKGQVSYIKVAPPKGMKVVVAIPDFELSTKMARNVLPESYSKEDTIHAISHAALLAASLASGDTTVLYTAMQDRIHQPYRMSLIPGMDELLENALDYGAKGIALSGAGPTIIALTETEDDKLSMFMEQVLFKHNITAMIKTLPIDTEGVIVESYVKN